MARERYYTKQAWLWTTADGKAYTNLDDGRTAVVCPRGLGWVYILAGVVSDSYPTSDDAVNDLIGECAKDHILLRRR